MARTLESVRLERGLTKTELALLAGLSRPTVIAAMAGKRVSLEARIRLAEALGVTLAEVDPDGAELVARVS